MATNTNAREKTRRLRGGGGFQSSKLDDYLYSRVYLLCAMLENAVRASIRSLPPSLRAGPLIAIPDKSIGGL